jgi:ABC-type multidrug transport system ATPase subunit
MYPLLNLGYSVSYSEDRVNEILSIFKREDLINKYIRELNICDKELLLIMISLLHKPSVLLLDSVLEIFPRSQSIKIINVLKKMKLTVINFTSSLELINLMDKIILMDNNKILGEYTPSDIYNNDKLFYEHSLEIPIITDLSIKLKMYNLVDKEYSNMKEMVDDIWP